MFLMARWSNCGHCANFKNSTYSKGYIFLKIGDLLLYCVKILILHIRFKCSREIHFPPNKAGNEFPGYIAFDKQTFSMRKLITVLFFALFATLHAQSDKLKAVDSIYSENIRTVRFYAGGNPTSTPIMDLKNGNLSLVFDDMDVEVKDYMFSIEQYSRNWQPSKLDKLEYLEGFNEERITNYKNAFTTNVAYMHYSFSLPTETMRITKSGNYLLKVFEDNAEKKVVITRRFVVYEQILIPMPQMTYSSTLRYNTHHEMDIIIDPKQFRVQNPINDLKITILQNGRWDNAINLMKPSHVQGEKIMFDYQDSITFPAGKEWRYVDLRSTRFRSERVMSINKGDDTWDYVLRNDLDRSREPYLIYPDLDGGYFIENTDFSNNDDRALKSDYVNVHFTLLRKLEVDEADVYLFGALTDWKIDERFKLTYDAQKKGYEADVLLKQGFYNYNYIVVPKNTKQIDMETLEGNWYETENEYTLLVYFTPFGSRHDRVIGYLTFKSNRK